MSLSCVHDSTRRGQSTVFAYIYTKILIPCYNNNKINKINNNNNAKHKRYYVSKTRSSDWSLRVPHTTQSVLSPQYYIYYYSILPERRKTFTIHYSLDSQSTLPQSTLHSPVRAHYKTVTMIVILF